MKNFIIACIFSLSAFSAYAGESCFIAKEGDTVLKSEGDCTTQYPPQSTFKVPLAIMGFDSGILKNENEPKWAMPKGEETHLGVHRIPHTPRTWMRDSVLWYSQIFTEKLGIKKFQKYVDEFDYGNKDLAGGVRNAWVSSSLQISPEEQVTFVQKIVDKKLPVSEHAYDMTKKVMYIQEMMGGWKLYGKTGSSNLHGWFIGYIEKGNRKVAFASHIVDQEKQKTWPSMRARGEAWTNLMYIINELEDK